LRERQEIKRKTSGALAPEVFVLSHSHMEQIVYQPLPHEINEIKVGDLLADNRVNYYFVLQTDHPERIKVFSLKHKNVYPFHRFVFTNPVWRIYKNGKMCPLVSERK